MLTAKITKPGTLKVFPSGFVSTNDFEFVEGTTLAEANVAMCQWAIGQLKDAIDRTRLAEAEREFAARCAAAGKAPKTKKGRQSAGEVERKAKTLRPRNVRGGASGTK